MPSRAIRLGVVVPRSSEKRALRESIWLTHEEVNLSAREIETALILMRGRCYEVRVKQTTQFCAGSPEDFVLTKEATVRRDALRFFRAAQKRNGGKGGSAAEIRGLMRGLYEEIIPSSCLDEAGNTVKGTAQKSCAFIRNLMLTDSEGNMKCVPIAQAVPAWLTDYIAWRKGAKKAASIPPTIRAAANVWLATSQCCDIHMKLSGATPGWIKLVKAKAGAEVWIPRHAKWHAKQVKRATGAAIIISRLLDLGLLPLLDRGRISRQLKPSGLSGWDQMAFKTSCAHLLAWETKGHEQRQGKEDARTTTSAARTALNPYPKYVKQLEGYENSRQAKLRTLATGNKKPANYFMTKRQVKGWLQLRATWRELSQQRTGSDLQAALVESLKQAQTKAKTGKFGDPHLFSWLIDPKRHALWQEATDDVDVLYLFSCWRSAGAHDKRTREHVGYCAPDAQMHPRWCEFEPEKGPSTNLRPYDLDCVDSQLSATFPLLSREVGGGLVENTHRFDLAASRQLRQSALTVMYEEDTEKPKPKPIGLKIDYTTGTGQHRATVRSAFLRMNRRELTGRSLNLLRAGDIGKVRLVPTLDVEHTCPADWLGGDGNPKLPATGWLMLSALGKKPKEPLEPGLRVLSVNLNALRFGGCSVFELVQSKQQPTKPCFHVQDDFWAVHERSFLITVPGERPSVADRQARYYASRRLYNLRLRINEVKRIWRVLKETPKNLTTFAKIVKKDEFGILGHNCSFKSGPSRVQAYVRSLNAEMSEWLTEHRKVGRSGGREWFRGLKSLESIEYAEECLSLYKSWQRMLDAKGTDGVFHNKLRDHVTHMKEERVKLGASLIIKAARGIVRGEQRWKPCQLVVFEDTARYRFTFDRSRAENRQLMRWCHRSIQTTTEEMGVLHGISVSTVGAGYISQIDAWTGAPGARCAQLREFDAIQTPEAATNADMGDIVPTEAGALLVSKAQKGKTRIVNAELNAAWNIQRRFWTRHADVFRIRAVEMSKSKTIKKTTTKKTAKKQKKAVADVVVSSTTTNQKRISGALRAEFGKNSLVFSKNCDGFSAKPKNVTDTKKSSKHAVTLFRDPSGLMLSADKWYESKIFWGRIQKTVLKVLGYSEE